GIDQVSQRLVPDTGHFVLNQREWHTTRGPCPRLVHEAVHWGRVDVDRNWIEISAVALLVPNRQPFRAIEEVRPAVGARAGGPHEERLQVRKTRERSREAIGEVVKRILLENELIEGQENARLSTFHVSIERDGQQRQRLFAPRLNRFS